jgi:prolyl-tRNA synthetase
MKPHVLIQELLGSRSYRPLIRHSRPELLCRLVHSSTRQRRDDFWSPTIKPIDHTLPSRGTTSLLVAAGFIRQNYAGIYQFLPLGLRVLEKLERLIDKHMRSVNASKVSLSSISSQPLWKHSGRLDHGEMFKFEDRGHGKWLLAPTHEEEITTMMKDYASLPRDLPVRLYQIGRKYRDEQRPRGGLLRGREFIMKDLYTFDKSTAEAEETYQSVRTAYRNLFTELGVPFVEVRADSGNMGGNLSHEFHFPNVEGEDTVITCDSCDYARNEEYVFPIKARIKHVRSVIAKEDAQETPMPNVRNHTFISKDSRNVVKVLVRPFLHDKARTEVKRDHINVHVLKSLLGPSVALDTGIEEEAAQRRFAEQLALVKDPSGAMQIDDLQIWYVVDRRVDPHEAQEAMIQDRHTTCGNSLGIPTRAVLGEGLSTSRIDGVIDTIRQRSGDPCPSCQNGKLVVQQAIEIGHTFHLGTYYTSKFHFKVPGINPRQTRASNQPFVEMGCHGIGVTRLVAAASACMGTRKMLRWPRAIAPFEVVICVDMRNEQGLAQAHAIYDELTAGNAESVDVLLDDRQLVRFNTKMTEAFAVGAPVVVLVGKALEQGMVELRSPISDYEQQDVVIEEAVQNIRNLLQKQ